LYSDIGDGESMTLDDRITDYENTLTSFLSLLRNIANGEIADPCISAEVVAHLSIRGAYLHEIFSSGVRQVIKGTSDIIGDKDVFRSALFADGIEVTPMFVTSIDKSIEQIRHLFPLGFPASFLKRLLINFARESFDSFYGSFFPLADEALMRLVPQISEAIRRSHARAFDTAMAPDKRVSDLATLSWRVHRSETALILPDCVAISIDKTWTSTRPYLMEKMEDVGAVMLPIASNQLLIGLPTDSSSHGENFDFNNGAAGCSAIFFVSSEDSEHLRVLSDSIGKIADGTISSVVEDTLSNACPRNSHGSGGSEDEASLGFDVPPVLSSTTIWSPIPQTKEIGREEAFFRRANHRLSA
jgi:hypothetical protein